MNPIEIKENKHAAEILMNEGFYFSKVSGGQLIFTNIQDAHFEYFGRLSPIEAQQHFLSLIKFDKGMIVFVNEREPYFITYEQFFILESEKIPRSALSFRDYFDYSLEEEIGLKLSIEKPYIGPTWFYLYAASDLKKQISAREINLSFPIVGSGIRHGGNNLQDVVDTHKNIKQAFCDLVPLPITWLRPKLVTSGSVDNVYDTVTKSWFNVKTTYESNNSVIISIFDLANNIDEQDALQQHNPQTGEISEISLEPKDFILHFKEYNGKFNSKRKLSRIKLSFDSTYL